MTRTLLLLAVSAALFTLPVTGWAVGSSATEPLNELERQALDPSREMIEQGRSVAQSACATCHGLDGISTAEGKPHLAGQRTVYLYRVLQAYQERDRKSNSMNHAADFLNKEALLAVSAYYANLPPARPEKAADTLSGGAAEDAGDPFAGIRDDMKKCIKCHGEDGNSSASGMPNLSAQDPVYFAQSMNAYVDGGRNHRMMERLVADLDESAIADMGVFYAVQPPRPTETAGKGDAAAGQAAAEPCANCHGADGNANGADMPTLAGQDPRYFVKAMKAYKDGKRQHEQMFEAVDPLSEADIDDLATFYAEQQPVRRNVRAPLTSNEWIQRCERCHGLDGNSSDPRFPMLAGQDKTYLKNAVHTYTTGTNGSTAMHAMADPLKESDIDRIVSYYAAQEPKSVIYMRIPCENDE